VGKEIDRLRGQINESLNENGLDTEMNSVQALNQWLDMLEVIEGNTTIQHAILARTQLRHRFEPVLGKKIQDLGDLVLQEPPSPGLHIELKQLYVMLNALFQSRELAKMCLPIIVAAVHAAVEERPITIGAFEEMQAQICEYNAVSCGVSTEEL
jgi:hypothetical protein